MALTSITQQTYDRLSKTAERSPASSATNLSGEHLAGESTRKHAAFREDTWWAFVGAAAQSSQSFLLVYLLSRYVSPEEVGELAVALAMVVPIHLFIDRAIRTQQATHDGFSGRIEELLGFRCIVGLLATVILSLFAFSWQPDPSLLVSVILLSGQRVVEGLGQVLHGPLHRALQLQTIGYSQAIRAIACLFAASITLASGGRLHAMLTTVLWSQCLVLAVYDRRALMALLKEPARDGALQTSGTVRIRMREIPWRVFLTSSLPLAVAAFLVATSAGLPRLILSQVADAQQVAVLTMASYLSFPASLCIASLMQAALPRMSRRLASSAHELKRIEHQLTRTSVAVGALNMIGLGILGPALLAAICGPGYQLDPVTLFLSVTGTSIGFVSAVPATFLTAQGHYRVAGWTCLVSFLICLVSCVVLIPVQGIFGATLATCITNGAHGIISLLCWRRWRPNG